ncbi:MAG: ankyrin repeat domain-containing protein [Acidiferrobacterales bacterium]
MISSNSWLRISTLLSLLLPIAQAGPLHDAAERGDLDRARTLIAQGANVNARDTNAATPLHWAVYGGHTALARWLIAQGADVYANETPFCPTPPQVAATLSDDALTAWLDHQTAHINDNTQNGVRPLHWAAAGGHLATVELLITEGANINAETAEGITPLQTAAGMGHEHIVKLLRRHGAKE